MEVTDFGKQRWFRLEDKGITYLYLRTLYGLNKQISAIEVSDAAFDMLKRLNLPFGHLYQDYLGTPQRLKDREVSGDILEKLREKVAEFCSGGTYQEFLAQSGIMLPKDGARAWTDGHNIKFHDESNVIESIYISDVHGTPYAQLIIKERYLPFYVWCSDIGLSPDSRYLIAPVKGFNYLAVIDTDNAKYATIGPQSPSDSTVNLVNKKWIEF